MFKIHSLVSHAKVWYLHESTLPPIFLDTELYVIQASKTR